MIQILKRTLAVCVFSSTVLSLPAQAVPFSSDIVITGGTEFDAGFSFGPTSGSFGVTEGGVTTLSTYAGDTSTGADPLEGTLTDIGDGFGFDGSGSATDDEFSIGLDTVMNVTNTSASDSFEVLFSLDFSNFVNADGDDAFADSELTLNQDIDPTPDVDFDEVFFSDLISDTYLGDFVDGFEPDTFGDSFTFSDDALTFLISLAPNESFDWVLGWTVEGGDFEGGLAEFSASTFLSVTSVTNVTPVTAVPEPSTLFLLAAGLLGLAIRKRTHR
jgi:hypothetical protein